MDRYSSSAQVYVHVRQVTVEGLVMDGWAALTALLRSPQGRAALTGGTPGQVVKLVRLTLGWTQQDL
ncbi:MAG: hypothetical protein ACRDRH_29175, partial [Pseudonocardia sp.]